MSPSAPPLATITVARRFRGPALSGNGGYTAGRLAALLSRATSGTAATVTLRSPPPLDVEMAVLAASVAEPGAGVEVSYGGELVASAVAGELRSAAVAAVDFASATAARSTYRGAVEHPFRECFVCGPAREPGDGLRLAPGEVEPGRTACVWVPDPSYALTEDPTVAPVELGWAALDCPGGWTSDIVNRPLVLGQMTAYCAPARIGRPHVVVGELLGEEGRKTYTATAVYDEDRLIGRAEHTWIAVDPAAFQG